jgi:outer membrane biosynthesis protein TonB
MFDLKNPWPILVVVALHAAFFYALQAGLLRKFSEAPAMREVIATLIAPEAPRPPLPKIEPPPKPPTVVQADCQGRTATRGVHRPGDHRTQRNGHFAAAASPASAGTRQIRAGSRGRTTAAGAGCAHRASRRHAAPIILRVSTLPISNNPRRPTVGARRMGDEGKVILRVHVDAAGSRAGCRGQDEQRVAAAR